MKKTLTLLLALVALTGCVGVKPTETSKPVVTPPLPPGYTPKAAVLRSPKAAMSAPMVSAAEATPEVWVPEKLYIQQRPEGVFLCWLTNAPKYALMATTNISTPPLRWEVLGTHCKSLEGDHWMLQVTNTTLPQRFFRMMSVPTNSVVFGWTYDFNRETNVVGFVLYDGPSSNTFNVSTPINYLGVWNVYPLTDTNRHYYGLTARDISGIESDMSNIIHFAPGDPPGEFSPPCP